MKTETLRLTEFQTRRVRMSRSVAMRLVAGRHTKVAPDPEPGWWSVTASHYVGTLVVEDLRIYIKPKIRLENLFLLLGVGLREQDWMKAAAHYDLNQNLLPAVVSFFTRSADLSLRRGVYRHYREERDRLSTIRGRIDTPAEMTRAGIVYPIACRFDEYTADIAENRYLKAAILKSLRVPGVLPEDRRRLHRLRITLEEVSASAVVPELLDRIDFNRLNAHYEPTLRLARLLLENLTLTDDPGETQAVSFMVDMNHLFERFVTDRLQRSLRGRLDVRPQHWDHLGRGGQVPIRPDMVFRRRGENAFVGDLKYKVMGDKADAVSADYYQLLAYLTALDLPEGALIYCREPGADRQSSITVRNADKVLHTWGVDLSGSPAEVEAEVERLADWIANRADRVVPVSRPALSVAS